MIKYENIEKGVCAPLGFKANGVHAGIRQNKTKKDLMLIVSDKPCNAAAVYTQNLVKGAPLAVTKEHLKNNVAQAVICNSGNANTCNDNGIEIAQGMCELVSKELGIRADDVLVASTGVIGQKLSLDPIEKAMKKLMDGLGDRSLDAAKAVMTTDTFPKECAVSFYIGNTQCRIGGIAKGSGMIHPNMATMLSFITTDVSIDAKLLEKALQADIQKSYNMLSIDGDTSTNDMVTILANGLAGNEEIENEGAEYAIFTQALHVVTVTLCRMLAEDGEGATKLLTAQVDGAKTFECAKKVAKSVVCSSLFKSAMFGEDANWGRILCAIGYSGAQLDPDSVDVSISSGYGKIDVCRDGHGVEFSEDEAKKILQEDEILISIHLNSGEAEATAWGCDLSYDYVKINGDYRT